jgi:hypothetical protein
MRFVTWRALFIRPYQQEQCLEQEQMLANIETETRQARQEARSRHASQVVIGGFDEEDGTGTQLHSGGSGQGGLELGWMGAMPVESGGRGGGGSGGGGGGGGGGNGASPSGVHPVIFGGGSGGGGGDGGDGGGGRGSSGGGAAASGQRAEVVTERQRQLFGRSMYYDR